jgi:hypothetical protein
MATFFNPATLLPRPSAAVAPLPQSNTAAFAIGSAMASIKDTVRKYQELENLKKSTEDMASYVEDQSPQLAQMLRARTEQYKPNAFSGYDAIDVNKEKDSLLRGTMDLLKFEQDERKMAADGNSIRYQNNYSAKLRAAESNLNNVNNNWNTWEANENRRMSQLEDERNQMSAEGVDQLPPPPVRQVNPYTQDKEAANQEFNKWLNATPEEIQGTATISAQKRVGLPVMPYTDESGAPVTRIPMEEPDLPTGAGPEGIAPENLLGVGGPPPESQSTDLQSMFRELEAQVPYHLSENQRPPSPSATVINPPPAAAPPGTDYATVRNENAKAAKQARLQSANLAVETLMNTLKRDKASYVHPDSVDATLEQGERILQNLAELPNPGSPDWTKSTNLILDSYKLAVQGLQRNSAAVEQRNKEVAEQEPVVYNVVDSVTNEPVTFQRRMIGGVPTYWQRRNGVDVEVTNQIGPGKKYIEANQTGLKSFTEVLKGNK